MSSPSILFIAAHPYLEKSRVNRAVVEAVEDLQGITLRRLYHMYPFFHIDVEAEQKLLLEHDLIVVQHPFYWYNMPPLLKMWLDEVLQSGWAYGEGGDKLKDKKFLLSLTVGGAADAYAPGGYNQFPLETLLTPWVQTVQLCQMEWHRPRVIHGSIRATSNEIKAYATSVRADLQHYLEKGVLP